LQKVHEVIRPPIKFDLVEEFSFKNEKVMDILEKNNCILKGPVITRGKGQLEENVRLAKELDLFANVVHCFTIPGVKTRHQNLNIVVIRENTEGEYSGLEHEVYPGVIESIKVITKASSVRIAEYAFEYAYLTQRKKVTAVHKANIMY
jgi:isocitrate dehydrogenase (NAD+)